MAEIVSALCKLSKVVPKDLVQPTPVAKTNPLSSEPPKPKPKPVKPLVECAIKNATLINFDKELRLIAKRSALMLGAMNPKSRKIVVEEFEKIDFYDPDFTEAMKRLKIIK